MNNFLGLHSIYLATSRWKVISKIYTESKARWKILMWLAKAIFLILSALWFMSPTWLPHFAAIAVTALVWGWGFNKARSGVYEDLKRENPRPFKYFFESYKYIRYSSFKSHAKSEFNETQVDQAIYFTDVQIEANTRNPVFSHPLITIIISLSVGTLINYFGKFTRAHEIAVIISLFVILYFSYMVIAMMKTPSSDLREFRQFLYWLRLEYADPASDRCNSD